MKLSGLRGADMGPQSKKEELEDELDHEHFQLNRGVLIAEDGVKKLERHLRALVDDDTMHLIQDDLTRIEHGLGKITNRHSKVRELEGKLTDA